MPYTINQSGAVTSLTIVKLNAIDYAQRSQQQGFDNDLSRIFIVEGGVGGGSSLGGGGSAAVDIATTSKAGIVMVPASGGLVRLVLAQIKLVLQIPPLLQVLLLAHLLFLAALASLAIYMLQKYMVLSGMTMLNIV